MQRGFLQTGLVAGLAVLVAGAAAPAAWSQPIRLIPPNGDSGSESHSQPSATPAPAQLPQQISPLSPAPASPAPDQTNTPPVGFNGSAAQPAAPAGSGEVNQNGFVIESLKAPDPSTAGLLDDGNGGLGADMWHGTDLHQALRLLSVLPAPVTSPALRDLQRRLLLTTAEVPTGTPGTPSLLGQRIVQLYRLGLIGEAWQLADPKPPLLKDPIFTRLPVEDALLRNDLARACTLDETGLREDGSAYWQKLAVFCRYHAKDIAGGDLALSLWRDGGGDDPAFAALAAAVRGDAHVKVDTLGASASPLHFAMLRAAGKPLPKDMLEIAPPVLLAALAEYDKATPELRLAAAEKAVLYGTLPANKLAEAYAALPIADAQRTALAKGKEKSARAAAFLYQSAKTATDSKTRAGLLRQAFDLAQARGLLMATGAVYKPLLNGLPPDETTISAAPAVIHLALAAGAGDIARLWYNKLLTMPPERDKAGDLTAQLWPLLLLSEGQWRDSGYDSWLATLQSMPEAERDARATLLLTLAEGAGIAVPPARWDALLAPASAGAGTAPSVAIWRSLLKASAVKAKAETGALALSLLGPQGTEKADGQSLATALGALRNVGLDADARRIALEAALLHGF